MCVSISALRSQSCLASSTCTLMLFCRIHVVTRHASRAAWNEQQLRWSIGFLVHMSKLIFVSSSDILGYVQVCPLPDSKLSPSPQTFVVTDSH